MIYSTVEDTVGVSASKVSGTFLGRINVFCGVTSLGFDIK